MLVDTLLKKYRPLLDLDQNIILMGYLKHNHHNGRMQSYYTLSEQGQYGYAYSKEASQTSSFAIDKRAGELIETHPDRSLQLAILDSIWENKVKPTSEIALTGLTPKIRAEKRATEILKYIETHCKTKSIIMIGYFVELVRKLQSAHFDVYCCDADIHMHLPLTEQVYQEILPHSVLIVSASYLTRDDFALISDKVAQAKYSILLAQTCSNMIQMHGDAGFDLIFSEVFPPYTLVNSTLRIYST